jgi:hypothetical protein
MPKIVDTKALRQLVLNYNGTYTADDIAVDGKVSYSFASKIIREMMGENLIKMDRKVGKKMVFVSVGKAGQAIVSNPMLSLTPAERFKYVGDCADMVIKGYSPSTLITGLSGVGKTYLVRQRLDAAGLVEGTGYHFVQGHSTPMGLYQFLHDHRDDKIIFDDCDPVFKDDSANILKCALDSYVIRKICWQSSRLPKGYETSFEFKGQIIFISNLDASRIDEAIKSRTIVIDLQMSRKEIAEYLSVIAPDIESDMDIGEKREVLEYLNTIRDAMDQFNIRTFIKACRIRKMADETHGNWKKMILVLK